MKNITIHLSDGNEINTRINGTEEQIRAYYKGYKHVTQNFQTGEETFSEVVSITFHNS